MKRTAIIKLPRAHLHIYDDITRDHFIKIPEGCCQNPLWQKKYTILFYDIFCIEIPYLIDLKPQNVQFLVRNVFFNIKG